MRPLHLPYKDPCKICGHKASEHLVPHAAQGNPCGKCGLPQENHVARSSEQQAMVQLVKSGSLKEIRSSGTVDESIETRPATRIQNIPDNFDPSGKGKGKRPLILGLDGEGQGKGKAGHKYVYLAASDLLQRHMWSLEDPKWRAAWTGLRYQGALDGLSTIECLEFLLDLPPRALVFGFALGYDWTKILTDVDNEGLYLLFRPELRNRTGELATMGPRPILWQGYWLNFQGTKFSVSHPTTGRRRVVWDIFKFYGTKFVSAIKDWKVGHDALYLRMEDMKAKRGAFTLETPDAISAYCREECACMAELAEKLIDAHEVVGLPLKAFHGPGSSAGAMLQVMGIKEQLVPAPVAMQDAVGRAFFGGRFENQGIGAFAEVLHNYDISSAYPYQTYFLPCLVHGTWTHTTDRAALNDAPTALVRYAFRPLKHGESYARNAPGSTAKTTPWAPFPYRFGKGPEHGAICFPADSPGGWVYRDEFLAGEALFPAVTMVEAWVYQTACVCRPFQRIPYYYLYRIQLGKEGPGITIKLAVNSVYGKLAQSIGNARFNSWLWAGMITSGCRAQLLELMGRYQNLSNVLMVATDGCCGREKIAMPTPRDTGTFQLLTGGANPKPLGGWEEKEHVRGMFLARPGIYFPMHPTEKELKEIKGRGVGKGVILANHDRIVETYERTRGRGTVQVANVERFCGAKTSISRSGKPGAYIYHRADGGDGFVGDGIEKPSYGEWTWRTVEMGFSPMPKRSRVNSDGRTLRVRQVGGSELSAPYDNAVVSREAKELKDFTAVVEEQPDLDIGEWVEVPL